MLPHQPAREPLRHDCPVVSGLMSPAKLRSTLATVLFVHADVTVAMIS